MSAEEIEARLRRAEFRVLERPWTVAEAAAWLGCSEEEVRRKARRGELAGARLGRSWRFDPEDVRALVKTSAGKVSRAEALAVVARTRRSK